MHVLNQKDFAGSFQRAQRHLSDQPFCLFGAQLAFLTLYHQISVHLDRRLHQTKIWMVAGSHQPTSAALLARCMCRVAAEQRSSKGTGQSCLPDLGGSDQQIGVAQPHRGLHRGLHRGSRREGTPQQFYSPAMAVDRPDS